MIERCLVIRPDATQFARPRFQNARNASNRKPTGELRQTQGRFSFLQTLIELARHVLNQGRSRPGLTVAGQNNQV